MTPDSLEPKSNMTPCSWVSPEGPETMVVSGGVVSTMKRTELDGALVLPATSVAVTTTV